MLVKWPYLDHLHLDPKYGLLNARSALLIHEAFKMLDWRQEGSLDDIQFTVFLTMATDLTETQSYKVMHLDLFSYVYRFLICLIWTDQVELNLRNSFF
jgi:hypothetical protein